MNITTFVWESIKSLFISAVLLVIGLLFLPDSWVLAITKKLKPKMIEEIKVPLRKLLNAVVNLYLNNDITDINEQFPEFNERTRFYVGENTKIEKNIYVIDLCKDMIATLNFALPRSVGENRFDIYEQSLHYLYHYSQIVEYLEQDKNFVENYLEKIDSIRSTYEETIVMPREDANTVKIVIDYCIKNALGYLAEEKVKLEKLYEDNKKKLINLVKEKSNGI
jgi:hypothetical protein